MDFQKQNKKQVYLATWIMVFVNWRAIFFIVFISTSSSSLYFTKLHVFPKERLFYKFWKKYKNIKSKFNHEANDKKRALPSLLLKICKPSYFLCANYCQLKNGKGDCWIMCLQNNRFASSVLYCALGKREFLLYYHLQNSVGGAVSFFCI